MAQSQKDRTGNGIKILSVVWFKVLPPKFGGQKAVAFFNQHLAAQAPLVCLCSKNNEEIEAAYRVEASLPVGKSQLLNPLVWRRIYCAAQQHGTTHILLEFPYHGIAGMICKRLLGVKLVVNTHNIEYRRFKEQRKWWWGLLFHLEKHTLQSADTVFFKTAGDLDTAKKKFELPVAKLSLAPYGVKEKKGFDKKEAQSQIRERHGISPEEKILLFAGTLDYAPNAEALTALVQKLIPLLNDLSLSYKIIVCGRNRFKEFRYLNELKNERLIMAGEVDNMDLYFEAADVFINPVSTGGGVQTKTMDAIAHQLNAVCFDSKRQGIEHAGPKIFSVPDGDWEAFAVAVSKALQTNQPTPAAFFETHDWRTIAAKAYQKMAAC